MGPEFRIVQIGYLYDTKTVKALRKVWGAYCVGGYFDLKAAEDADEKKDNHD